MSDAGTVHDPEKSLDAARGDGPPEVGAQAASAVVDDAYRGAIVLAATPIGDPRDASPRLCEVLATADLVAAEDTRRVLRLAGALGVHVRGRIVSNHEHNEARRASMLVEAAQGGATVLVVSDAGMPAVSDPGYRLVTAAVAAGVPVHALPGPSAVLTAIALSGLPSDRFCFEGFVPRRPGDRRRALAGLADERRTMVFFESPHRVAGALTDLAGAFGGQRRAAVCRELTKTYEEVRRGTLAELAAWAGRGEMRGEFTLVVEGATAPVEVDLDALVAEVAARVGAGERRRDAAGEVAAAAGVSRKMLYDASLRATS